MAALGVTLAWPIGPGHSALWWLLLVGGAAATVAGSSLPRIRETVALTVVGVLVLAALSLIQRPGDPLAGLGVLIGATLAIASVFEPPEAVARDKTAPGPSSVVVTALTAVAVVLLPTQLGPPRAVVVLALLALIAAALVARRRAAGWQGVDVLDSLLASPAHLLVVSFAALASMGTALLMLPAASTSDRSISALDALFTSVSATCVTGLIVLDTPADFTGLGQLAILGLIQLGGLGIMTFAAAAVVFMGRRLGIRQEAAAATLIGADDARRDLEAALRRVVQVTVVCEGLGALSLLPLFVAHGDSLLPAAWRALFTSVSAFCNAGFALQSDNLLPYQTDKLVLIVTSLLIIAGGLGPTVVATLVVRGRTRLTLHHRLVMATTAALLATGTLGFLAFEWSHGLDGLSVPDKLVNAWFQSVTLRTAGFNSIDFSAIQPATWSMSVLAMFVGGSPGSTAGGVKTTTMAILMLAVVAAIRGRGEAEAFSRRIPHRLVYDAAAITTLFTLTAASALIAMQLTQPIALGPALFEVMSALGTVGLSMGATAHLDGVGKLIIIACMFAGRVGPLTLFIVLVGREQQTRRYALESVQVG